MSLKGKDMIWGGIMRIPMDISTEDTTRSIMRGASFSAGLYLKPPSENFSKGGSP